MTDSPQSTPTPASERQADTSWADRLGAHAAAASALAGRGGAAIAGHVRAHRGPALVAAGVGIILFGLYAEGGSAVSLPLLIVGGLMIVHGLFGRRVSGSFSVSWGEDGVAISFDARVAAPGPQPALEPGAARTPAPAIGPGPPASPEVVEGSAETMEIEVARLKELLGDEDASAAPAEAATQR